MKPQSAVAVFLLLHMLAHPAMHGFPLAEPGPPTLQPVSESGDPLVRSQGVGPCLACRTASTAIAPPVPSSLIPQGACWQAQRGPAEPYHSQLLDSPLSPRAPPLS